MSASLTYASSEPLAASKRLAVVKSIKASTRSHQWWAESMNFYDDTERPGHIVGNTKLFLLSPDPAIDSFMASSDMERIVIALEKASTKYFVGWQLLLQGEPAGTIQGGRRDDRTERSIKGLLSICEAMGVDPSTMRRSAIISQRPANRKAAAEKQSLARQMRQRWTGDDILRVNRLLCAGTISGEDVGFVNTDGKQYIDLRGIQIRDVVREISLSHTDMSYCEKVGPGQFSLCRIEDCLFVGGQVGANISKLLIHCDFSHAEMKQARPYGEFRNCDFSHANFSGAMSAAKFTRCTFDGANFKGAHFIRNLFDNCTFKDCVFGGGSFAYSTFIGAGLNGIDFGDMLMDDVKFE